MRLWSIHPKHLDRQGLLGLWREGLGAQKALSGETKGYRNHPQLDRFKTQELPLSFLGSYLEIVANEGHSRGYNFRADRLVVNRTSEKIPVTIGQVQYEIKHLLRKLIQRDTIAYRRLLPLPLTEELIHPLFTLVPGEIESWERI